MRRPRWWPPIGRPRSLASSTEQPPREDEKTEAEQIHGREDAREVSKPAGTDDCVAPVPAGEHVVHDQHHALVEPVHDVAWLEAVPTPHETHREHEAGRVR